LAETRQQKEDANRALYTKLYADYKKDFATQLYRANKDRPQELTDDQIDELASQSALKALASSPDAAKYLGLTTAAPKATKTVPFGQLPTGK
jgi:hypothetical protein